MKLSATLGMRNDPRRLAEQAHALETAGVKYFWSGEAYTSDAVSLMGYLAAVTDKAMLGTSILPIYSRTPTLLAMTAVGLDQLSGGRFILGIGASGPQVIEGFHGVRYDKPLARTREVIEICRAVWRRTAKRSADLPPLDIVAGRILAIGSGLEHLRAAIRPMLALYFGGMGARGANFYNDVLRRYGYEELADDIQDAYLSGRKAEAAAMVPQELIDGIALVGEEGHVREWVAAYHEAGVTVLNVDPIGPNGLSDVATLAGWLS
jgi:alkanesulfonate monooxygenase SsuD/methylene tetrahydromethanopterin reductase-like flavin-dependent oxidoreductase (luciferase family)